MLKKTQPYSKLATIYDFVMKHVNYTRWHTYILEACRRYDVTPDRILEVACGTGTVTQLLSDQGHNVTGLDLCYGMLARAREKNGASVPLAQGNMAALPFKGRFDLIICLYDSINYLLEKEEITAFLQDAAALVRPDGLLIFDICTEFNSLHYFLDIMDTDSGDDFYFERRSRYRKKDHIQENKFKLYLREGKKLMKYKEEHRQRIYQTDTIETLIDSTGKYTFESFDGFTFKAPTFNTTRIHYMLRLK